MTCAAFSIKFTKTNQKFAENSEFCEKNSLLLVNYSLHSLLEGLRAAEAAAEEARAEALEAEGAVAAATCASLGATLPSLLAVGRRSKPA